MAEYISREEVMSKCDDIWNNADETTQTGVDTINTIDEITNFIESLPAADVQPVKRGKWESSQRTIETGTVYCSNCAIEYYISDLQTVGDCNGIVHYCPNCGARMDGDAE